ncbi:hypothetical protein Slin15195_G098820 [Septoria linicola]|uniref:Uncharacterized protein n=1 Tax=Septoria linicola TaxID=215465 RepID=A0A9Q9B2X3_9PEZI|nr:hypothetical protein Slin14017_G061880 [Septoria linicola]USW56563.1 hypothetical protein Slin15195_G098820 [Septoria linicola]
MSSSASSSASASPTLEPRNFSPTSTSAAPFPRPRKVSSQSQIPEAIPEDDVPDFKLQTSSIEQDPLDIKANLTELLNCDQVRGDAKMRQWIQSRLMDAELELSKSLAAFMSVWTLLTNNRTPKT